MSYPMRNIYKFLKNKMSEDFTVKVERRKEDNKIEGIYVRPKGNFLLSNPDNHILCFSIELDNGKFNVTFATITIQEEGVGWNEFESCDEVIKSIEENI